MGLPLGAPEELAAPMGGPPPGAPPSIQIGGPAPGMEPPPDLGGMEMGGLPPELASALGGEAPPEEAEALRTPSTILGEIRELLLEYMGVEPDEIDKKTGAAAMKLIQDLFARNQSDQETAAGITPAHRGMRKALGG